MELRVGQNRNTESDFLPSVDYTCHGSRGGLRELATIHCARALLIRVMLWIYAVDYKGNEKEGSLQ